jgi:diketogulonate reductase-like aldo/keto reductase
MRTCTLRSGEAVPVLGQGTWHMGEDPDRRDEEIRALRLGLDLGMTLIDTAEMYGDGASEELVGQAIEGRRDEVFLVSKVLPSHATRAGTVAACQGSLQRLGTDHLDLYLLHWRGEIPLAETLRGFDDLVNAGAIRYWGVSNFDVADMEDLFDAEAEDCATDQVLCNVMRRGTEYDLLPWCHRHSIPIMAYSPIEQGRMVRHPVLREIAARHRATPAQVALAWILRHDSVIAIPKASSPQHVRENHDAINVHLSEDDLAEIDHAFPPPRHKVPLEMI